MGTSVRESSRSSSHTSERKPTRDRSRTKRSVHVSESESESESESDREKKKKKTKKRKHSSSSKKEKKSHKKANKAKKAQRSDDERSQSSRRRRRDRTHDSDVDSDSDNRDTEGDGREDVNHERAAEVVRTLLVEFPSISSDLLALLQMLDDGETAVISGIANARVKTLLRRLFPLLGLKKLRKPDDAYVARTGKRSSGPCLLETVAAMLMTDPTPGADSREGAHDASDMETKDTPTDVAAATVAPVPRRRNAPIGPTMPPSFAASASSVHGSALDEGDEDDDVVGPALPGMKGFREADERVEAEMARRAKQLEEDEWRRARGEPPITAAVATGGREAWMTEMPTNNKIFDDAMGPMKPRTGQPAAFRSKEPAKIDSTWFDSPEERERGKRAKIDMDLLGYVRPENAPAPRIADHDARPSVSGPTINESILPAANPEADEDMRRQMDALKQKRGPSLLEQHQQKVAEQQKAKRDRDGAQERSTWDRDRDLTARRGLSQTDADRIVQASKEISSKFTAPTVTRQFL